MGGNSRAIHRESGLVKTVRNREAFAERFSIKTFGLETFREDVTLALASLNKTFFGHHGKFLWRGPAQFSGSARHLFDARISEDELCQVKPVFGDLDVMIARENLSELFDVLASLEGKTLTPRMTYLGQNRQKLVGSQINAVFDYMGTFVQIDFEGVEFERGMPTCFSRFAHGSNWDDLKAGIKGVGHKYLIMCLAWTVADTSEVVVLTDKSPLFPPHKVRPKTMHQPPRMLSFSVDNGLRYRMKQQFDSGRPVKVRDKFAFKEIPTEDSNYIRSLEQTFEILFGVKHMTGDLTQMWSFLGTLDLCNMHLSEKRMKDVFDQMVRYKLFGPGQRLDRDDKTVDMTVKKLIIETMLEKCPVLRGCDTPVHELMAEYYKNYVERKADD